MSSLFHDARYGWRVLKREPGFALVAMLTIALGVGATTTLFSVANGVLLKPLPWADSERLVRLTETRQGKPARIRGTITNGTFLAWYKDSAVLDGIGAYSTNMVTAASGDGEPARVQVGNVTASMFAVLKARPILGRLFDDSDAPMAGTGQMPPLGSVILSYGLWREWFGGRDDALGKSIDLDGTRVSIVGVMPREFAFPDAETRAWTPRGMPSVLFEGGGQRLQIFSALARMKPGVTPTQVGIEGTARARSAPDPGLAAVGMFGSSAPPEISAQPAVEALIADVRPAILLLLAAVVLLMAAATANVASLQLARAMTRRREIAVRAAIGAGTGRLTQQLLVESGLIGVGGAAAGIAVVFALHRALPSILPADFPRVDAVAIDGRVLLFAVATALATSMACGLLPAFQVRRLELTEALADGSAGATGGMWRSRTGRWRAVIMAGQVTVACVLLVGAALLARSFTALMHADRGYDPANVLSARIDLPQSYTAPRRVVFLDTLVERLKGVPGVAHVAAGNSLPFVSNGGVFAFSMPSPTDPAVKQQVQTSTRVVGPDYFQALRLRMLQGRPLAETDSSVSRPVIVVNRTFAQRYLGQTPIGARVPMPFGDGKPDCDVVGIVEDMRQSDVTEAHTPEIFASYRQMSNRLVRASMFVVARTTGDPETLIPSLRAAVREQDRMLVVDSIMTLDERMLTSLARPKTYATLLGAFALCALAIAGVGLFGVLSYGVAQRVREIGVRTALGAQPADIIALVLRHGMMMAGGGIVVGLGTALATARVLSSFLYGVTAYDAASFVAVAIVLAAVVALACIVPARRAARVDPLTALRSN